MEMSQAGLDMLIDLEGSKGEMYHDQAGLPTIGVGHLLTRDELSSGKIWINGQRIQWGNGLNDQQIHDLLAQDVDKVADAVGESVKVSLSQSQFDALVSFAFNIGAGSFRDSTLLKLLNMGSYANVPAQMERWVHSKGITLPVLASRREIEIARWESA